MGVIKHFFDECLISACAEVLLNESDVVFNKPPDPAEEPERAFNTLIAPLKFIFRGCSENNEQPCSISTVKLNKLVGVYYIFFGFAHLFYTADCNFFAAFGAFSAFGLFGEEPAVFLAPVCLFADHSLRKQSVKRFVKVYVTEVT